MNAKEKVKKEKVKKEKKTKMEKVEINRKFLEILEFRHACKLFNGREILDNELKYILECGRLSPSSFGMEPWQFLVIQDAPTKERLKPLCWNQQQITSCSKLILIVAKKDKYLNPSSDYVKNAFKRRNLGEELTNIYIQKYTNYYNDVIEKMGVFCWSSKQCYIALANMMNAAASIGVDSCPIEGFEKDKVEKELKIDINTHELSAMVAFGYRANEQGARARFAYEDIVKFI